MNALTAYLARTMRIGPVSLASVILLSGCTTLTTELVSSGKLTVDRVNSGQARIGRVLVQKKAGGLEVFGELYRLRPGRSRIPGHLHIKMYSQDGKTLAETASGYRKLSIKSRQSSFSATLPVRADGAAEVQFHRIHYLQMDRSRGVVVKIDRPAHLRTRSS